MYLYNSSGCNGHRRHSYRSLNTACAIGIHFVVIQQNGRSYRLGRRIAKGQENGAGRTLQGDGRGGDNRRRAN
ncbi:hypothetical protein RRG08_043024 [Elysia crispata]|uniref:Uncharacterized protein n=1 Tax=Elysia crispata TaxID=231223 RepID=A0AAE0XY33_9GAST|nr:hypothetical protein RRG08_043024 [Elysia crispata]